MKSDERQAQQEFRNRKSVEEEEEDVEKKGHHHNTRNAFEDGMGEFEK